MENENNFHNFTLYMKSGNTIEFSGDIDFQSNVFGQLYSFTVKKRIKENDYIPLWISLSEVECILVAPYDETNTNKEEDD